MPFLLYTDERGKTQCREVGQQLSIGRLPENDLALHDDLVSRKHCVIELSESGWTITDLSSRFGTFLNDDRVTGVAPLGMGDRLRIGNTSLMFAADAAPSGAEREITGGGPRIDAQSRLSAELAGSRAAAESLLAWMRTPAGQPPPLAQAEKLLDQIAAAEKEATTAQRSQELAVTLADMGRLIHLITDLNHVLKLTMDLAVKTLGADRGYILLRDEESGKLAARTSRNMGDMRGISTSIAESVTADAREVLTSDATTDPRFKDAASVMVQRIRAVMCVPLLDKSLRAIGAIYVDGRPGNPMFSPEGLEFLKNFAAQAGLAMENAHLVEKSQRLSRYFSGAVLEDILSKNIADELRGRRKIITVLFTDIRGFTSMMETLAPADAVEMLREYFTEIVDALFEENGNLDKYTGDGIMAFWGAPIDQPEHALLAVRAAMKMQARMPALRERWRREGKAFASHATEIVTGIGIHTGEAVVGDIGSLKRLEYTGIGDVVNLAARVQGVAAGGEILITGPTLEMLKDRIPVEALPAVSLKGKSQPVPIFRVKGV